jgi:hypothetical protein
MKLEVANINFITSISSRYNYAIDGWRLFLTPTLFADSYADQKALFDTIKIYCSTSASCQK